MTQGMHTRLELARLNLAHHPSRQPVRRIEVQEIHTAARIAAAYAALLQAVKRAVETVHAQRDKAVMIACTAAMLPWEWL